MHFNSMLKIEKKSLMNKGASTMRKRFTSQISLTSLLAGVLLMGTVQGQSYFNASLLGRTYQGNARAMALGHVGSTESFGVTNLFTNPALLAEDAGISVEGGISSAHRLESRSYPMTDQFLDVVTDNIYNISESWQPTYYGGGTWSNGTFAIGAGITPYWSPFFRYEEDVRGNLSAANFNRDPLVGTNQLDRSGQINETSAGFQAHFNNLNVGLSLGFLNGNGLGFTYGTTVRRPDQALPTDTTDVKTWGYNLDKAAMVYRAGFSWDVTPRFRFAVAYESSVDLTFTSVREFPFNAPTLALPEYLSSDSTFTLTQTQPASITAGVRLQPKNLLRTRAYFEVEYVDWTQFKMTYPDSIMGQPAMTAPVSETLTFRGGIEHELFNGMPFRAGLIYAESPMAKSLAQTWITVGSGYHWQNVMVDVAAEYGKIDYESPDLFVAANPTHDGLETVHESTTKFALTLAYTFK